MNKPFEKQMEDQFDEAIQWLLNRGEAEITVAIKPKNPKSGFFRPNKHPFKGELDYEISVQSDRSLKVKLIRIRYADEMTRKYSDPPGGVERAIFEMFDFYWNLCLCERFNLF
jgi:hypothetical protein